VCLSQTRSGHIGDAVRLELDDKEWGRCVRLDRRTFLPVLPALARSCAPAQAANLATTREESHENPSHRDVCKLAGFGLGAIAVQELHAQAKPPVYQVVEIDVLNQEVYLKDYVPKA
jgi:hypothetical protein